MGARPELSDDEVVYRRIPSSAPWFEPPDRISPSNFTLNKKRGDLGLSVYRASSVTAAEVLAKPEASPDSKIASAKVGAIRKLTNGKGEALNLYVVPVDDEDDPGHSEIRGPILGKLAPAASKALHELFKLVPTDNSNPGIGEALH